MHQFIHSIGFSSIKTKAEFDIILKDVMEHPNSRSMVEREDGSVFCELSKEYGTAMGIAVRGEYDKNDVFQMEYYFPYFSGVNITTEESVEVEKHADKDSYAAVCDEVKIGVTLIFYLSNAVEYLNLKRLKRVNPSMAKSYLSGLASKGMILLPVNKDEKKSIHHKKVSNDRDELIEAARDGDEDAIESLTLEDIDTYSMLSRRILREDILTIVDTYFMPYGIESDQYSIMGEIMDFSTTLNTVTGEEVCAMTISCNHLSLDVCINKSQLLGEPSIGRRFKGIIWMQGIVKFSEI
ncbi:MAG: DUF3881 family protein [Lachnospiraceae bacterium]